MSTIWETNCGPELGNFIINKTWSNSKTVWDRDIVATDSLHNPWVQVFQIRRYFVGCRGDVGSTTATRCGNLSSPTHATMDSILNISKTVPYRANRAKDGVANYCKPASSFQHQGPWGILVLNWNANSVMALIEISCRLFVPARTYHRFMSPRQL